MLFDDYANDLAGISEPHLLEILAAHRRERNWFPKVAELVERLGVIQRGENLRFQRARTLLDQNQMAAE